MINTLDTTLEGIKQKDGQRTWLKLLPIQELTLQALGCQDEALQVLDQCPTAAEPEGYVRIFVERGTPMALLLKAAREMLVAPSTLRTHIRNIYLKLDVHGRLKALQKAKELGLL